MVNNQISENRLWVVVVFESSSFLHVYVSSTRNMSLLKQAVPSRR